VLYDKVNKIEYLLGKYDNFAQPMLTVLAVYGKKYLKRKKISLCIIYKESMCLSSGVINGLMMMGSILNVPQKCSQFNTDTVNAKNRRTTIYWRVNKFLKESHIVTRFTKELV
jgi:hypothetical protein